jgi:hypothetical protein
VADQPAINPYAPPQSDGEALPGQPGPGAFERPLFSPRQAVVATIFGTLLAGVILMQANYRAMGRSAAANKALVLGLLSTAVLIAVGFALPKNAPSLPINIIVAIGFYKLINSLQGQSFFNHQAAGGARQSNWLVFGIIAATVVAVLLVVFIAVFASGAFNGLE